MCWKTGIHQDFCLFVCLFHEVRQILCVRTCVSACEFETHLTYLMHGLHEGLCCCYCLSVETSL